MTILVLAVFLAVAYFVTTPEERIRFAQAVVLAVRRAWHVVVPADREDEAFRAALRERAPFAPVTSSVAALNAAVFLFMLFGAGALADPDTLVGWGGSIGPRTTNGEWWRLVTTAFVHAGVLQLVASLAGLVPLGLVLERLVGSFVFAAVYFAAAVLSSLASLSAHPVDVTVGAAGAVFGVYGLLVAWSIAGVFRRAAVTIPLAAVRSLGPPAAVFVLYNLVAGGIDRADVAGFAVGLLLGLALVLGVAEDRLPVRRVAAAMAVTLAIAVGWAIPLRGVVDVRPELDRIVVVEDQTVSAYGPAVERYTKGRMTAAALAELIDRTILPELRAARARLGALAGVPREHQALVAAADEYLRLRDESWRLRAEGLRRSDMGKLRGAERTERTALEALERIRPAGQN
jgi:membrane associated rhomboid family serine protease